MDRLSYEAKEKAVEGAEELEERSFSIGEVLALFVAYEEGDVEETAESAVEEIRVLADRLGTDRLVIYPWVHLTDKPARFMEAKDLQRVLTRRLADSRFTVHGVPIGWYKSFEIKVKGHPLAESLRVIGSRRRAAEQEQEQVSSELLILQPSGREGSVEDLETIADEGLRAFVKNEVVGKAPSEEPPAHIELMRRLELVDYEPTSDVGHFRFYPEGTLVKRLIEDLALTVAERVGAMEIETPLMYRLTVPAIAEQAERFAERGYSFKIDGTELTLRFAGDFGLFEMMKDMTMSYKQLPLSFYEISPSFRLEQRGECRGLRRLRGFTMPDVHTFTADVDQAFQSYRRFFEQYDELLKTLGIGYVIAFRIVKGFYDEFKPRVLEMLRSVEKAALIELLPSMKHYWAMKHEFQFIDRTGGSAQLSTVQLDLEDSARYGIYYVAEDGRERPGIIVHTSMGSIERFIYAILEQAAKKMSAGDKPILPIWLSPTQVRVLPVAVDTVKFAKEVAEELADLLVRADLDDRDLTLSKKVREAERRWIPYIAFVGDREIERGGVTIRRRMDGASYFATIKQLAEEVKSTCQGMPYRPINLPMRLSRRPRFVGAA